MPYCPVQVKMYNYPCVVLHAPCHAYNGHSSHVTNVRWSADEAFAYTTGGKDRATLQWRMVREPAPVPMARGAGMPQALDGDGVRWAVGKPPIGRSPQAARR